LFLTVNAGCFRIRQFLRGEHRREQFHRCQVLVVPKTESLLRVFREHPLQKEKDGIDVSRYSRSFFTPQIYALLREKKKRGFE
jgi:hypothetical protein